ncbi:MULTISPECIES: MFS transporter [unclassified Corynebacterium]|uniref:MFS transporter n=1 Tax=unclassified Corynebacterium TaxID=2624378 RepID=UPI0030AF95E7
MTNQTTSPTGTNVAATPPLPNHAPVATTTASTAQEHNAPAVATGAAHTPKKDKKEATLGRVATASMIGTTIEFYDFFIYGTAAALVFPTIFFPNMTPLMSTIASFATFGVAFLARPLGSIVFGHFGDQLGRKRTLVWTLLLMGFATLFIGLLPGYQSGAWGLFENGIGIWGPILLVAMRFAQGLAVGGEWAGATLLTAEYAPPGKRGLYAIFPQIGPAIAFFLSSGTFLLISVLLGETSDAFINWGWRIPFVLSVVMVAIGMYVRVVIDETPSFAKELERREKGEVAEKKTFPFMDTLRYQWKEAVLGGVALASLFTLFYMGTSFLTSYATGTLGHSRQAVLAIGMGAAIVFGISTALSALYSDRIGRNKVILISTIGAVIWSPFLFYILDMGTLWSFTAGLYGTLMIFGIAYGPAGAMLPELFRVDLRYTGAGLAYNIAAILGGAIPPLLAAAIAETYGGFGVGLMLAGFGITSSIAVSLIRSNHSDEIDADGPATA